jgi:hypothetical protein
MVLNVVNAGWGAVMKIAILGWGSLIPSPRDLSIAGDWREGGPVLRIEFSRISSDGRLTLVIDLLNGSAVNTLYATSTYDQLQDAICNLMAREGTGRENIGIASKQISETNVVNHPQILPTVQAWLTASSFDAVIWTDLKSNYREKRHADFSTDDAHDYLENLPSLCKENARKYIKQAPPQTKTALRQYLETRGWL